MMLKSPEKSRSLANSSAPDTPAAFNFSSPVAAASNAGVAATNLRKFGLSILTIRSPFPAPNAIELKESRQVIAVGKSRLITEVILFTT
jgi:hypothetical protein